MAGLVRTEADYKSLLADLKLKASEGGAIALDTETTGLRLYRDDVIRGISVAYRLHTELRSWYLPISHAGKNFKPSRLITAFNRHKGLCVFHNGPFDWTALTQADKRYKLPEGRYYDTQVMSWLVDENADHRLKQLGMYNFGTDAADEQKHLAALRRGRPAKDFYTELRADGMAVADAKAEAKRLHEESRRDWATFTGEDIADYACKDTELTLRLKEEVYDQSFGLREEFVPTPEAFDRELRLQFVLWRMMRTGIAINEEVAARQAQEAQARHDELAALFEGVNLNSTPQLRKLLFDEWGLSIRHRTPTGAPSTNRAALEEMEGDARVRDLMEYRRLQKALVAYYRPFVETVSDDGRIRPSFSSTRTVTGRFSCSDPNLQTIPRGDTLVGVRDVFVPGPGYELWEYDLDAAELRVQASLSGDLGLMGALNGGVDLHSRTAEMVWGADFTPLQRRLAKNLNYGFSYGIGPRKFATYMVSGTDQSATECAHWPWPYGMPGRPRRCRNCTVCQAAAILDGYRQVQPDLVRLMKGLEHIAKNDGFLELAHAGRYRHFRSPGQQVPYFTALNAMVQGGVAETMKDVMLEAEPELDRMGARLCLQVHDSLVVEVRPGDGEQVHKMLQVVLDDMNVFAMRMLFTASPWGAHA